MEINHPDRAKYKPISISVFFLGDRTCATPNCSTGVKEQMAGVKWVKTNSYYLTTVIVWIISVKAGICISINKFAPSPFATSTICNRMLSKSDIWIQWKIEIFQHFFLSSKR
jgi:hypothetical protein